MDYVPDFHEAAKRGYNFIDGLMPNQRPKRWLSRERLAMDAEPIITPPNTNIPGEFTTYIDPKIVEVLTRQWKATAIANEVKKGTWADTTVKFRTMEFVGSTQPYTDWGQSRTASANYTWPTRDQYIFQTLIEYGELEQARAASARISYAADKQRAAAHVINSDANLFYLYGIAGLNIFGLLNNPQSPAALAPLLGAGGSVLWDQKKTPEIFNDILEMLRDLVSRTGGWVDQNTPLRLLIAPETNVLLGRATDFNISVQKMLDDYFSNLEIITVPELASDALGDTMMLLPREVGGEEVVELGFSEKVRAFPVIQHHSGYSQKWASTTYGAFWYVPYAVSIMRGMTA